MDTAVLIDESVHHFNRRSSSAWAKNALASFRISLARRSSDASTESGAAPADMELTRPSPPPEVPGRADFRVGNRVTFTDKNLQHRVGLIVRVNQRTATLDCDGQQWRAGFELLRHLVEV